MHQGTVKQFTENRYEDRKKTVTIIEAQEEIEEETRSILHIVCF